MPCIGRVLCGLGLLLSSGCGLAVYEAKMKEAQERLRQYEEETKILDPAERLLPPTKSIEPQMPPMAVVEFHLRAPRGIASAQGPMTARLDLFYDYDPLKPNAAAPFERLSIAFAPLNQTSFADQLLSRLRATSQPKQSTGMTRLGLNYRRLEFDTESSSVAMFLFQGTKHWFAIVYFVTKGQLARAARAIEMSLNTFGFDGTLEAARQAVRPGGPLEYVPR
ncbi:MAG: hypothetical protein SNJ82_02125 [Gemmataceae bacterium]